MCAIMRKCVLFRMVGDFSVSLLSERERERERERESSQNVSAKKITRVHMFDQES